MCGLLTRELTNWDPTYTFNVLIINSGILLNSSIYCICIKTYYFCVRALGGRVKRVWKTRDLYVVDRRLPKGNVFVRYSRHVYVHMEYAWHLLVLGCAYVDA